MRGTGETCRTEQAPRSHPCYLPEDSGTRCIKEIPSAEIYSPRLTSTERGAPHNKILFKLEDESEVWLRRRGKIGQNPKCVGH